MAQHMIIGTFTRNTIRYRDWLSSYQKKAVDSAKAKINFFEKRPLIHRHFESLPDFSYYELQGKRLQKLSQDYLPPEMRNKGNLAFCIVDVFYGNRDVCGGWASAEIHYDTMTCEGTVYMVA